MTVESITQKRLKELLNYDPLTGVLVWLISCGNVKVGGEAGTLHPNGYVYIKIDGIKYLAHRLAFLYMTGKFPKNQVDHDNHIRHDNRWGNIYEATNQENHKNRSMNSNNSSDYTGVTWYKVREKWGACICVNGKRIFLGLFTKKADAIRSRKKANIKYGFHKNHGIV